ncbi:MAG TPA: TIGR03915 family putative DNA repair protein [Pedobacter sp.]|jgi:probable DNA metabolism protein
MTTLVYDASWPGFLTSVFEVYEFKFEQAAIVIKDRFEPTMFGDNKEVLTDMKKAGRVWLGLKKGLSGKGLHDIYSSFLSGLPDIEKTLLLFIQLVLKTRDAEVAYGNEAVLKVSQVSKMVHREKHRMEAFIRFRLTRDGIYYAHIEPDFNVIPLIAPHFKKRYADQKWLIYDLKRSYGIYYDLETVQEVTLEVSESSGDQSIFCEEEEEYQTLWKDYFKHVNIESRKNTKLHLQHVPKRYWKHLTEKFL